MDNDRALADMLAELAASLERDDRDAAPVRSESMVSARAIEITAVGEPALARAA